MKGRMVQNWVVRAVVLALALGNVVPVRADPPPPPLPRVRAPYFPDDVRFSETAIFWFGRVTPMENYADVRVGYNDDHLYLHLAAFDRRLWYDPHPSADDLTAWDAATIYLDLEGNEDDVLGEESRRFVGQLSWWEPRDNYQAAYRGDGSGWVGVTVPFTTTRGWRGNAPNDDTDDRGWALTFDIPFTSLGLSGPPPHGTIWGLAVALHDRDNGADTSIPDMGWPRTLDPDRPVTWGQLAFGLPVYTPPSAIRTGATTIRQGLDEAIVPDADVGGGTVCGDGLDFWTDWGEANHAGCGHFNVQNQADVADWPCFSKYYVTFPLDSLPSGKAIISATLTLHQFGNSGGGAWGEVAPSLIQVFTIAEDWSEELLTWNNAPLAWENVGAAWVDPLPGFPGWPGVLRTWDVSWAVAQAYAAGTPLRLALYSADGAYHSGKYFVSSDTGGWNAEGYPTLRVAWGDPVAVVHKEARPVAPVRSQVVTYTLSLIGDGRAITLTDSLPAQVSAPGPIRVWPDELAAGCHYDPGAHRVMWQGSPTLGQPVTISLPVTVQVGGPLAVFNTAVLTDFEGRIVTDTAVFIVDASRIWLPLTFRDLRGDQ